MRRILQLLQQPNSYQNTKSKNDNVISLHKQQRGSSTCKVTSELPRACVRSVAHHHKPSGLVAQVWRVLAWAVHAVRAWWALRVRGASLLQGKVA